VNHTSAYITVSHLRVLCKDLQWIMKDLLSRKYCTQSNDRRVLKTNHVCVNHSRGKSAVFGRPFVKRFALCYRTVVLSVCAVCDVGVLWPNGWMDQDETWHGGRPRPRPQCVRWRPSFHHHQFSAHVRCDQTVAWIKMSLGMEAVLGPGDFVLDGDSAPP